MKAQSAQPAVFNSPVKKRSSDLATIQSIQNMLSNPTSVSYTTIASILATANLDEYLTASRNYAQYLDSQIGKGINTELKQEFQDELMNKQRVTRFQEWSQNIKTVYDMLVPLKLDTLKAVKAAKFPLWNSVTQSRNALNLKIITVTSDPNLEAKSIGAQEIEAASHVPLKYINTKMLQNALLADRIDYVSALLERVGLNRKEFKTDEWKDLVTFGLRVYDSLGITERREFLKFLDVLIKVIKIQLDTSLLMAKQISPTVFSLQNTVAFNVLEVDAVKHSQDEDLCEW